MRKRSSRNDRPIPVGSGLGREGLWGQPGWAPEVDEAGPLPSQAHVQAKAEDRINQLELGFWLEISAQKESST